MRCKEAEKQFLRFLDGRLEPGRADLLDAHLRECPRCGRMAGEYQTLLGLLKPTGTAEPRPFFWERLRAKLREDNTPAPLLVWERWCLRAVPFFVGLVAVALLLLIVAPIGREPLSQTEALLLENASPLTEARPYFEGGRSEDRNVMLLFASLDENSKSGRRP